FVFDRPGHAERCAGQGSRGGHDGGDNQVGVRQCHDGGAQSVGPARFVVVVVDLGRIVRIHVDSQRVFQHQVVGIGPGHEVVGAGGKVSRYLHRGDDVVTFAIGQGALVG